MLEKKPLLSLRNISKAYKAQHETIQALKNVSMDLYEGEIVSLLGINGAGKSTLSAIIATLYPPSTGELCMDGVSVYKNVPNYRMHIGLCPQHPNLNAELTLEQNLVFSGMAYRMPQAQAQQRAKELMHAFELTRYAQQTANILSGGFKQRFSLARSLMHNPSIIILDEPTVGLDPHVRHELWEYVKKLRDNGKTILLTTHYLEEAEELSDRVYVLDKGIIKIEGTPETLKADFNKGSLQSVFLELIKNNEEIV